MNLRKMLAVTVSAAVLGTLASAQDAPTASTVLATVNGTEITVGHVIALTSRLPDQYQGIADETLFNGVLDQLIQQTAIGAEADRDSLGIKLALENENRALLAGEVLTAISAAAVTDEAVQAAYEKEYVDIKHETEYKASHILVKTEEEAKALIAELNGGADFAALAKERSTGPSGVSGGDLGWFIGARMVPEFGEAVATMELGAISEPIKTQFGWHVIKLFETRDEQPPALEDVRAKIEDKLKGPAITAAIKRLEAAATITRTTDGIDPSIVRQTDLLK